MATKRRIPRKSYQIDTASKTTPLVSPINRAILDWYAGSFAVDELLRGAVPSDYDPVQALQVLSFQQLEVVSLLERVRDDLDAQFQEDCPGPRRWELARHRRIVGGVQSAVDSARDAFCWILETMREAQMQGCEPPSRRKVRYTDVPLPLELPGPDETRPPAIT